MNLLFNGWVGLLDDIDSAGKLTITLNGPRGYAEIGGQFGGGWSIRQFVGSFSLHGSRLGHGLLRPVVDPATEQAGGVGV